MTIFNNYSVTYQIDQRVKISDKASVEDAKTGTNDTKWMTPVTTAAVTDQLKNAKIGDIVTTARDLETETNGAFLKCDGRQISITSYPGLKEICYGPEFWKFTKNKSGFGSGKCRGVLHNNKGIFWTVVNNTNYYVQPVLVDATTNNANATVTQIITSDNYDASGMAVYLNGYYIVTYIHSGSLIVKVYDESLKLVRTKTLMTDENIYYVDITIISSICVIAASVHSPTDGTSYIFTSGDSFNSNTSTEFVGYFPNCYATFLSSQHSMVKQYRNKLYLLLEHYNSSNGYYDTTIYVSENYGASWVNLSTLSLHRPIVIYFHITSDGKLYALAPEDGNNSGIIWCKDLTSNTAVQQRSLADTNIDFYSFGLTYREDDSYLYAQFEYEGWKIDKRNIYANNTVYNINTYPQVWNSRYRTKKNIYNFVPCCSIQNYISNNNMYSHCVPMIEDTNHEYMFAINVNHYVPTDVEVWNLDNVQNFPGMTGGLYIEELKTKKIYYIIPNFGNKSFYRSINVNSGANIGIDSGTGNVYYSVSTYDKFGTPSSGNSFQTSVWDGLVILEFDKPYLPNIACSYIKVKNY